MQTGWFTESKDGIIINVKAQPRSSKAGVDGLIGDALKVRIRAAPVDGKANQELIETLSDAFHLPMRRISFVGGETGRQKRLLLTGLTPADLLAAVPH